MELYYFEGGPLYYLDLVGGGCIIGREGRGMHPENKKNN